MIRGYIRVSTKGQMRGTSLEDQREALEAQGCEALYTDVRSGASMDRPEFQRMCSEAKAGDTIVVTKMDRIARTEAEAYELVMAWVRDGIKVHIINLGLIEDTPTGRLILHIMLSFAEFEKDMIQERLQGGRQFKRTTDPAYRDGRKPKFSRAQMDHAIELLRDHSYKETAEMTGISKATIAREAARRGYRKMDVQ